MGATFAEINAAITEQDRSIVMAFASENMNVSSTARRTHYHYRTIQAHLDRVFKKTKLNPKEFHDLVLLVFAISDGGVPNAE